MQVLSINDFELAQETQLDCIMDSAVDDLERLIKPPHERPTVEEVIVLFGQLHLGDDIPHLRFQFDPPTTCRQWPGPRYGYNSLHKPIPSKPKTKALKATKSSKKHSQPDDFKPNIRPVKVPKPKNTKRKSDAAPTMIMTQTSRDPPLHLLTLPAELRNAIWDILAVHNEPIHAQLRRIQPCKKLSRGRGINVRRFPLEPVVAAVSHQVRDEVLSIFYGDNRFIFQKNKSKLVYNMLSSTSMQKWQPRQDVSKHLSHLQLHIDGHSLMRSYNVAFDFVLGRLADGRVTIEVEADKKSMNPKTGACLCLERGVAAAAQQDDYGSDLVTRAMQLVMKHSATIVSRVDSPAKCEKCGKSGLIIYS